MQKSFNFKKVSDLSVLCMIWYFDYFPLLTFPFMYWNVCFIEVSDFDARNAPTDDSTDTKKRTYIVNGLLPYNNYTFRIFASNAFSVPGYPSIPSSKYCFYHLFRFIKKTIEVALCKYICFINHASFKGNYLLVPRYDILFHLIET